MKKCICKQTSVRCSLSEDRVCLNSSPLFTDLGNHPRQSSSPWLKDEAAPCGWQVKSPGWTTATWAWFPVTAGSRPSFKSYPSSQQPKDFLTLIGEMDRTMRVTSETPEQGRSSMHSPALLFCGCYTEACVRTSTMCLGKHPSGLSASWLTEWEKPHRFDSRKSGCKCSPVFKGNW